jgi:hypothetical protein
MKQKILVECQRNYFYFIRNVVRIPSQGGPPDKYRMNRGMLAMNFCLCLNLDIYLELPRQQGKTIGSVVWYLWLYNFGSRDSMMIFLNKKMETAKELMIAFVNIAQSIYESAYKDELGEEVSVNVELKDGREMQITIAMKEG